MGAGEDFVSHPWGGLDALMGAPHSGEGRGGGLAIPRAEWRSLGGELSLGGKASGWVLLGF